MTKIPNVVLHILALPLVLLGFIILSILWVFRQLVRIRLQEKYGDQFGGLLISPDKAFAPKYDKCRKITMLVLQLRSDKSRNMVQFVRQLLLEKVSDTFLFCFLKLYSNVLFLASSFVLFPRKILFSKKSSLFI